MNERAQAFREIATALLSENVPRGSCHGCHNIGDDAVIYLRKIFPDDLSYIKDNGEDHDKEAWIDDEQEEDHD